VFVNFVLTKRSPLSYRTRVKIQLVILNYTYIGKSYIPLLFSIHYGACQKR